MRFREVAQANRCNVSLVGVITPPAGVPFISPDLSATDPAIKSGYTVTVAAAGIQVLAAANTCNTNANSMSEYLVTATPVTVGSTGQRSFGSDNRGTIYQDGTGAALVAPLAVAGTVQILQ